jgi:Fe-S cluster assembly iron-binding protein IscA
MGMTLDEPQTDETVTSINGIDFLISKSARGYEDRIKIDYSTGLLSRGFTISLGGFGAC